MLADKINKISKINDDLNYLKDEYKLVQMSGCVPDGEVRFEKLMEWLSEDGNEYLIEHMIIVNKDIKSLEK
tara:strand:+ start:348 stop:560 length:213 start_codon:yes stop_codon:yes gene_type:complete